MEIYNPTLNTWTRYNLPFPAGYFLYPKLHLLPNGRVSYSDSAAFPLREYNPATNTWRSFPSPVVVPPNGSSVLLPLFPPYAPVDSQILTAGGANHNQKVTNVAKIIRPVDPVSWTAIAPLQYARTDHNATVLPNGHVLITGGATKHQHPASDGVRQAEWFNPATRQWTTLAAAQVDREYHSVALLLPDATVWTAGSNPVTGLYENRMEIYAPPYLFTKDSAGIVVPAVQPTIDPVTVAAMRYGSAFPIYTPDASSIASIMLIRPGTVTHSLDMEQRAIQLSFTWVSSSQLNAVAPPNGSVAPQGYYMLFLVNARGVPSVAKWVYLN